MWKEEILVLFILCRVMQMPEPRQATGEEIIQEPTSKTVEVQTVYRYDFQIPP